MERRQRQVRALVRRCLAACEKCGQSGRLLREGYEGSPQEFLRPARNVKFKARPYTELWGRAWIPRLGRGNGSSPDTAKPSKSQAEPQAPGVGGGVAGVMVPLEDVRQVRGADAKAVILDRHDDAVAVVAKHHRNAAARLPGGRQGGLRRGVNNRKTRYGKQHAHNQPRHSC